jgi:hypothetical protein
VPWEITLFLDIDVLLNWTNKLPLALLRVLYTCILDAKVKQELKQEGSRLCIDLYINFPRLRKYKSLHCNILNLANNGAE